MSEIYGEVAGAAFVDQWTTHTDAYIDYVSATASGNNAGRRAALAELTAYQTDFSQFLANANPQLSASALRSMLEHHTDQLVDQADAYANGDYARAYTLSRETFRHAVTMGDALALAIAAQFPDVFPDASTRGPLPSPALWLGVALLVAAFVAWRTVHRRSPALG